MNCAEYKGFVVNAERLLKTSRAERALSVKHLVSCRECQHWHAWLYDEIVRLKYTTEQLKTYAAEASRISELDLHDQEFRETAFGSNDIKEFHLQSLFGAT